MGLPTAAAENTASAILPDKFKEDHSLPLHFPCGMCEHRHKDEDEVCRGCRFYFN